MAFIRKFPIGCSLLLSLALLHCKSESTGGASAGDASSGSTDFVTEYCALVAPCCTNAKLPSTGCTASNSNISAALPQVSLTGPIPLDPAAAQACLDAIKAASGSATFCTQDFWLRNHPECSAAKLAKNSGTVAVGGSCNDAVTGTECAPSKDGQTGCVFGNGKQMCQLQVLGEAGDACDDDSNADGSINRGASFDGAVTDKGVYCDRSAGLHCTAGKCAAATAIGKACVSSFECVVGAYCDFGTHVCLAQQGGGTPCTSTYQCIHPDGCDFPTKTCPNAVSAGKGPADVSALCQP